MHAQLRAVRTDDGAFERALAAIPASSGGGNGSLLQSVGSGEKAMSYLARYVQKTALDHARILAADEHRVTIDGAPARPKNHAKRGSADTSSCGTFCNMCARQVHANPALRAFMSRLSSPKWSMVACGMMVRLPTRMLRMNTRAPHLAHWGVHDSAGWLTWPRNAQSR